MQKATLFALLSPVLYALGSVILEYKFSKYNNLTLIVVYGSILVSLAILMRMLTKNDEASYNFPTSYALLLLIGLGVIFFAADYFLVGAYTNGGDLLTVTIAALLVPVFASLFKLAGSLFISGMIYNPPNFWLASGYVLAGVSVILVIKGASTS